MVMGLFTFPLSFIEKAINVQQRWAKFPSKRMRKNFENKRFFMTVLITSADRANRLNIESSLPRRGNICRLSCFVRLSLVRAEKHREKIRLVGEIKHTKAYLGTRIYCTRNNTHTHAATFYSLCCFI